MNKTQVKGIITAHETVGMDPKLTDYEAPKKYEIAPTAVRSDLLGVD